MLKIVIDTNVIVSAALSPYGNPADIINLVSEYNEIQVFYSYDMLIEYQEVLSREYLGISVEIQDSLINAIKDIGTMIEPSASNIPLPDEDDRTFYDTAKTKGAILITGNIKHYPPDTSILSPTDFLTKWNSGALRSSE